MKRFGYLFDPLFLLSCALYAANRWLIKPHIHAAFFHNWFNDVLLIPCALPPVLLIHAWLGLRPRNAWPGFWEITAHLAGWSVLFEWIGPHIMRTTGDPWDVVSYFAGGSVAFLWWRVAASHASSPDTANFDRLAPHYRWMETVLAGQKLQLCRTAFLARLEAPSHALLLGVGHGHCLCELLRAHPDVRCTCVDSSGGMLAAARANLERHGLNPDRVEFIHADVLSWQPPAANFDVIITCFFLDCFRPEQLARLIPRIAASAAPQARWLIADFQRPDSGWQRWRATAILKSMYLFFRHATHLPASELTPADPLLEQQGFIIQARRTFDWGLLHSDLWQRPAMPAARQNTAVP